MSAWTTELPTKPGRYWHHYGRPEAAEIVKLVFKERWRGGVLDSVDSELTDARGVQNMGSDDMPIRFWGAWWDLTPVTRTENPA